MSKDIHNIATDAEMEISKISTSSNFQVKSGFGYFGSKTKLAKQIISQLPPHNCWVEAFCGSAALTCAKKYIAPIEVINDIDDMVVNLFKQLRDNEDELIRIVEATPYSRTELEKARIQCVADTSLEKARKFLVESMLAINGAFGSAKGGFSYSNSYSRNGMDARVNRWNNLPLRLQKVCQRLKQVRIENIDANKLLNMFVDRPGTLIYLDPPYLGNRTKGYKYDIHSNSYHQELLQTAKKSNSMIFISSYENELYNDMLTSDHGWSKKTLKTLTKSHDGIARDRQEVIWMNYQFQKALKTNQVQINLSAKEIKENKINPSR